MRQRAAQAAGATAGTLRYGEQMHQVRDEIKQTNRRLDQLHHDLHDLRNDGPKNAKHTGDAVAKGVNKGATVAARRRRR
jgi:hypothetical protein